MPPSVLHMRYSVAYRTRETVVLAIPCSRILIPGSVLMLIPQKKIRNAASTGLAAKAKSIEAAAMQKLEAMEDQLKFYRTQLEVRATDNQPEWLYPLPPSTPNYDRTAQVNKFCTPLRGFWSMLIDPCSFRYSTVGG